MKPVTRRSVTTGLAAVVTAIPAVGLAREDPLERIKKLTRELGEAMREAYGVEVETLTFDAEKGMRPLVMVVAHTTGGSNSRGHPPRAPELLL